MKVLWVTSFNTKLYEVSGRKLLSSKEAFNIVGDFFIGKEGSIEFPYKNVIEYKLEDSLFLNEWLEKNKDIAPPKPCNCINPFARLESQHKKYCPHTWFNRNTYRWFRKIATLYHATRYIINNKKYKYVLWIDSDCYFKNNITFDTIDSWFSGGKENIIYLKGIQRKVLEAGFVGYNVSLKETISFISNLCDYYNSGNFRVLIRWDDSYVIQKLLFNSDLYKKDIATTVSDLFGGVFENSLIGSYIGHNKGLHGRITGIMK